MLFSRLCRKLIGNVSVLIAKFDAGRKTAERSCFLYGDDFELLGQRRLRIEGVPRLSLAHRGDQFYPIKNGFGVGK